MPPRVAASPHRLPCLPRKLQTSRCDRERCWHNLHSRCSTPMLCHDLQTPSGLPWAAPAALGALWQLKLTSGCSFQAFAAMCQTTGSRAVLVARLTVGAYKPCCEVQEGLTLALLKTVFTGVTGTLGFENHSASTLRRSTDSIRVSILAQPHSAPQISEKVYPALNPVASVSLAPGIASLEEISESAKIRWPNGQMYPPTVAAVQSLMDPRREADVMATGAAAPAPPLPGPAPAARTHGIVIGLAILGAVVGAMLLLGIAFLCVRLRRKASSSSSRHGTSVPYLLPSAGGLRQGSAGSGHRGLRREQACKRGGGVLGMHSTSDDVAGVQYVEMLYRNTESSSAGSRNGGCLGWIRGVLNGGEARRPPVHSRSMAGLGSGVAYGGLGDGGSGSGRRPGSLVNIGAGRGMWEVVGLGGRSAGGSLTPSEDASGGALREAPSGHGHWMVPLVPLGKRASRAAAESDHAMDTRRSTSSITGSGTSALQVRSRPTWPCLPRICNAGCRRHSLASM